MKNFKMRLRRGRVINAISDISDIITHFAYSGNFPGEPKADMRKTRLLSPSSNFLGEKNDKVKNRN